MNDSTEDSKSNKILSTQEEDFNDNEILTKNILMTTKTLTNQLNGQKATNQNETSGSTGNSTQTNRAIYTCERQHTAICTIGTNIHKGTSSCAGLAKTSDMNKCVSETIVEQARGIAHGMASQSDNEHELSDSQSEPNNMAHLTGSNDRGYELSNNPLKLENKSNMESYDQGRDKLKNQPIDNFYTSEKKSKINQKLGSELIETCDSCTLSILLSKQSLLRRQKNSKLSKDVEISKPKTNITPNMEEIIIKTLAPDRINSFRCKICRNCVSCSPLEFLTRDQRIKLLLQRESYEMSDSVKIINCPINKGKLRILTRLPVIDESGGQQNLRDVIAQFDKKMVTLPQVDKNSIIEEFQKALANKFVTKLKDLPTAVQDQIESYPKRYVNTVAAFKASISTPARVCVDFSSGRKSENESSLAGLLDISVYRTIRAFRAYKHIALGDLQKFYNCTLLSIPDIARHLFVWRDKLMKENPSEIYCYTRMTFGHRAASSISNQGVRMLCKFAENQCKHCSGRYSTIDPLKSRSEICYALVHLLSRFVNCIYVDDLVIGHSNRKVLLALIEYAKSLFNLFSFNFKGIDVSKQETDPDSKTLNPQGFLSFMGYNFKPQSDEVWLKSPILHNGIKSRGRIIPARKGDELIQGELTKEEDISVENILKLLGNKTFSLKVMVSLAGITYDPLGLCAILQSQIRHSYSTAMKLSGGDWDKEIPRYLRDFFLLQLVQLFKCTMHRYKRYPITSTSEDISYTLLVLCDASISIVLLAYLVIPEKGDTPGSIMLWQSKTHLCPNKLTIPLRELLAICLAAELSLSIIGELPEIIRDFYIINDSKVGIYWVLGSKNNNRTQTIFTRNKIEATRHFIKQSMDILENSHHHNKIKSRFTDQKDNKWQNHLLWISSKYNTSDTGTKFQTFDNTQCGGSMINAEAASPESNLHKGEEWMTNMNSLYESKQLIAASNFTVKLNENEKLEFDNGFKASRTSKIEPEASVILAQDGSNEVFKVKTGAKSVMLTELNQPTNQGNLTEINTDESENDEDNLDQEEELIDDGRFTSILATAIDGNLSETNEVKNYLEKSQSLHKQRASVKIIKKEGKTGTVNISHLLGFEQVIRFPFSKSIRIMLIVITMCHKFLKKLKKTLTLTSANNSFLKGLVSPAKLDNIKELIGNKIIEDISANKNQSEKTLIHNKRPILLKISEDPVKNILEACRRMEYDVTSMKNFNLDLLKRDKKGNFSFYENLPDFLTNSLGFRRVIQRFSEMYHCIKILKKENVGLMIKTKALFKILSNSQFLLIENFFDQRPISDSGMLIIKDLTKIHGIIFSDPTFKGLAEEKFKLSSWLPQDLTRKKILFNPSFEGLEVCIRTNFKCLFRTNNKTLTIVDVFENTQEFDNCNKVLTIHLANKISSELRQSYPAKFIEKIGANMDNVIFLKSRIINFEAEKDKQEELYHKVLKQQGFHSAVVVIGALSSIAYSIINTAHAQGFTLNRKVSRGNHAGIEKTISRIENFEKI